MYLYLLNNKERPTASLYIYIYMPLYFRCSEADPLHTGKNKKIKNLARFEFYGSVLLIMQLQYSKQSVTTVVISRLQHI
jgi:hypothetical protein